MPAGSFVGIWKFIARPNLCGTPACVKPPPRYLSGRTETRSTVNFFSELKKDEADKK